MRTSRSDGRARRDAILDAALRCFARQGLLATGIEEIRREAGASPSSVYHLFGGVEDVTLALLVRIFEDLFPALVAKTARAATAEKLVVALVRGHVDWVVAHRDEARFMYQAMSLELTPLRAKKLAARKAELLEPLAQKVALFVARRELPRWPVHLFDVVLLGATHEACRRWLGGATVDPKWMRSTLPKLAWSAIRYTEAGR